MAGKGMRVIKPYKAFVKKTRELGLHIEVVDSSGLPVDVLNFPTGESDPVKVLKDAGYSVIPE